MRMQAIAGLVMIVVGIALLVIGINAADSFGDRMSKFFTGNLTDKTMWYIVLGAVLTVIGIGLVAVRPRLRG